jgi:hypothetical protein
LECIETTNQTEFIIFSDSISCLLAISHQKLDHPILTKIFYKLHSLTIAGFDIKFCWIPGHAGIKGNEQADQEAKRALNAGLEPCPIPYTVVRPSICKYIREKWQHEWDDCPNNKLHEIVPTVDESPRHSVNNRRDQVVLARCRIGHS